jgi:hypothetical protein
VAHAANTGGFPNDGAAKSAGDGPIGEYRLSLVRTGSNPLETPLLLIPDNNVFDERVDPALGWTSVSGARIYDVLIASSADFAPESIVFQSTRTDTTVVAAGLPAGTVLFWRVRAGNELGPGQFSITRQFQTTFAPVVVSPISNILLPTGSTTVDLLPVFSDPEGGELSYRVVSLSDSAVASVVVDGAELQVTATGSGATVVTIAAQDPKGAETPTSFGVIAGQATANEHDEQPPSEFAIGANYPNPFSTKTVVPVYIPESSEITLSLFDVLGSEVKTLVRERVQPGRLDVDISATDLAPGVYLLRLESKGGVLVSPLMVTR